MIEKFMTADKIKTAVDRKYSYMKANKDKEFQFKITKYNNTGNLPKYITIDGNRHELDLLTNELKRDIEKIINIENYPDCKFTVYHTLDAIMFRCMQKK